MKRKITIILAMILVAFQCMSCGTFYNKNGDSFHMNSWHKSRFHDLYIWLNASRITKDYCRRIYLAYKSRDVKKIKKELSKKLLQSDEIEKKLEDSIDVINGDVVSYKIEMADSDGDYISDGRLMQYSGRGVFELTTIKQNKYKIYIYCDIVNIDNPENIGINHLFIDDVTNGKETEIVDIGVLR